MTATSGISLHSGKYQLTLLLSCIALNLSLIRMHSLYCQVSAGIRFHHLKLLETLTYSWMKNWHHRRNTQQIRAETDLIHVPHYIAGSSHYPDWKIPFHYLQVSFIGFASVYNESVSHPIQKPHKATP